MNAAFEPGARAEGMIPLCVPEIGGDEWRNVQECLDTGWVSSVGSFVTEFEKKLAGVSGMDHAVATVSGTAALHIALECAGVGRGDEVLLSTLTFIAPANAIRYTGAHPIFIDSEPEYWQIDPMAVERFLTKECSWDGTSLRNRVSGRRIKAVLPVDILGSPADLDPIVSIAKRFGLAVIEDATESLGTRYKGSHVGSRADIACFSFNGNKLITTGGGGMIATNSAEYSARARYLTTQAKDDPVEYIHGAVGYNYRLTNVQAAIGVAQMKRLDEFVSAKRQHAACYGEGLVDIAGITMMREAPYAFSTYWLNTILVEENLYGRSSRSLLRALASNGIQTRPLWQPLHRSPAHAAEQFYGGQIADRICRDALSLPSSVGLTQNQLNFVVDAVRKYACT